MSLDKEMRVHALHKLRSSLRQLASNWYIRRDTEKQLEKDTLTLFDQIMTLAASYGNGVGGGNRIIISACVICNMPFLFFLERRGGKSVICCMNGRSAVIL